MQAPFTLHVPQATPRPHVTLTHELDTDTWSVGIQPDDAPWADLAGWGLTEGEAIRLAAELRGGL